jgi:hypothetical protein
LLPDFISALRCVLPWVSQLVFVNVYLFT